MTHKGTATLETERLILRTFTPDDAESMFQNIASDPDVVRFMLYDRCDTIEATRKHIDQWLRYFDEPGARELFAIVLKSTGEVIGTIDHAELDTEARSAEVGYQLGKSWWGKGYTTEALRAVLAYCFETVGLNRVWADYDTRNTASGRVMQKAGMRYEGTFRQCKARRGELIDKAQYAMLAEDYFNATKFA